jgi:hypothetical protein
VERIYYANDSILTGTDIARALLEYARALAAKESSATIDIPIRTADGSIGHANFLLGPASQIVSETVSSDFDELIDEDLVATFVRATARLENPRPVATEQPSAAEASLQSLDFSLDDDTQF